MSNWWFATGAWSDVHDTEYPYWDEVSLNNIMQLLCNNHDQVVYCEELIPIKWFTFIAVSYIYHRAIVTRVRRCHDTVWQMTSASSHFMNLLLVSSATCCTMVCILSLQEPCGTVCKTCLVHILVIRLIIGNRSLSPCYIEPLHMIRNFDSKEEVW